jgi:MFS family permease
MDGNGDKRPATSALAPLSYPTFRSIWTASLASNLGGVIQGVGAAWLMTSLTSEADLIALVQASNTLPVMFFALAAGAIADTFDRRRVILAAQFFTLGVALVLALVTWLDIITPWVLLALTFLLGCGAALNNPAWQASVGDMVPRDAVSPAIALNGVNFNLSRSVGPAIGGLIVATAGAAFAFLANAISYLPLIIAVYRWDYRKPPNALPPETLGHAMTAGLRYVALSPNIETVLLRACIYGASGIVILALLPVVTRDLQGGGPVLYGLLLGAYGIGAIAGAFLGVKARDRWSNEAVCRAAFALTAAGSLTIGLSGNAWITGAGAFLAGLAWVSALSMFNATVQLSTPRWVVGRAMALYQTATFGGMALASWIWGVVAERFDLPTAFVLASLLAIVGLVVGFRFPMPAQPLDNLDPLNRWKAPDLRLALQGRSGPVNILIEYVVREDDTRAFLRAMNERRRIRRRDGARQWELLRDTEHPDHWMESYHVPTWNEYVRHNQRRTQADAAIDDKVRALHSGTEPPRVHRMVVRPTEMREGEHQPKPPPEPV